MSYPHQWLDHGKPQWLFPAHQRMDYGKPQWLFPAHQKAGKCETTMVILHPPRTEAVTTLSASQDKVNIIRFVQIKKMKEKVKKKKNKKSSLSQKLENK